MNHANHHNNNHNGIKVDQQVNQENQCNRQPPKEMDASWVETQNPSTMCVHVGENQADIGH